MFRAKAVENKREYVHCNVTFRRVHETTLAVESNKYYIFLCCVRACERVREGMRMRACVRPCVGVHERGRVLSRV
jgi:hypothetical protein